MSYLLLSSLAVLTLSSAAMTTGTGLNAFDNYKLENNGENFFIDNNKKSRYKEILESNFGIGIIITLVTFIFFLIVYNKKININYFWLFFIFLLCCAVYYGLSALLLYSTAKDMNKLSTQSIVNWIFTGVIIILAIIIIICKKNIDNDNSDKIKNPHPQG